MNEKYILKVEDQLCEQTYKFRDGQVDNVEHLQQQLTNDFYDRCLQQLAQMRQDADAIMQPEDNEEDFIEII